MGDGPSSLFRSFSPLPPSPSSAAKSSAPSLPPLGTAARSTAQSLLAGLVPWLSETQSVSPASSSALPIDQSGCSGTESTSASADCGVPTTWYQSCWPCCFRGACA